MESRFQGILLGGAIGDALGAPVEFMKAHQIRDMYGPYGVRWDGFRGQITDDTQMTLFSAEAIIWDARYHSNGQNTTGYSPAQLPQLRQWVYDAYKRWFTTQRLASDRRPLREILRDRQVCSEGLAQEPWLYALRAPGTTCMSALHRGKPVQFSKGCGGVMRAAPFGMQLKKSPRACFHDAVDATTLTHGHPDAYLPAGALAAIIRCMLDGMKPERACYQALRILRDWAGSQPTQRVIKMAMGLAQAVEPTTSFPKRQRYLSAIGEGWIGTEALGIALYSFLVALRTRGSFLDAVSLAVSHDGDSDSTGAIAGNLAGALGAEVLPPGWEDKLEGRSVIKAMASKLLAITK